MGSVAEAVPAAETAARCCVVASSGPKLSRPAGRHVAFAAAEYRFRSAWMHVEWAFGA